MAILWTAHGRYNKFIFVVLPGFDCSRNSCFVCNVNSNTQKSFKILRRPSQKVPRGDCAIALSYMERLTYGNNNRGAQLLTLFYHMRDPGFKPWPPWVCCASMFFHLSFLPSFFGRMVVLHHCLHVQIYVHCIESSEKLSIDRSYNWCIHVEDQG